MKKIFLFCMIVACYQSCSIVNAAHLPSRQYFLTETPTHQLLPSPQRLCGFHPRQPLHHFQPRSYHQPRTCALNIGSYLLEDDFSIQNGWTLTQSRNWAVLHLGNNELTIAIGEIQCIPVQRSAKSRLFSDFYLEITASPSLCRDLDEYGVLFRVSPTNRLLSVFSLLQWTGSLG